MFFYLFSSVFIDIWTFDAHASAEGELISPLVACSFPNHLFLYFHIYEMKETFTNLILTETVDAIDQVESESQSFVQEFSPDVPGIYAFCVDNSRSRFMPKKIEVCMPSFVVVGYCFDFSYLISST